MPKIKIDPEAPLKDFILQHGTQVGNLGELWAHTEAIFHWDGAYLYLVPKEEVPDQVVEDLKLDAVI
jgi:hypothetical protein